VNHELPSPTFACAFVTGANGCIVAHVGTGLDRIKQWLRRTMQPGREEPVASPPPGATEGGLGDVERETSTNAQAEGAADEPWPGNT
jgi:hypothetical protein